MGPKGPGNRLFAEESPQAPGLPATIGPEPFIGLGGPQLEPSGEAVGGEELAPRGPFPEPRARRHPAHPAAPERSVAKRATGGKRLGSRGRDAIHGAPEENQAPITHRPPPVREIHTWPPSGCRDQRLEGVQVS